MDLRYLIDIGLIPEAPVPASPPAAAAPMEVAAASTVSAPALAAAAAPPAVPAAGFPPPPAVHPRGTPLDGSGAHLSVLSYNLLAPAFVRPIDKRTGQVQPFAAFEWAEPAAEVLDWDARRPRLLEELRACRADLICLQEVQFEVGDDGKFMLPRWLDLDGYATRLPMQLALQQMAERNERVLDNKVAVGAAVLYRTDRLELFEDGWRAKDPNTRVTACIQGKKGSPLAGLGRTVVVSAHLDAQSEEKRLEQLRTCLAYARLVGVREVVIAGDLNTECLPGSCIGAFVADAPEPTAADLARECATALRLGEGEGDGAGAAAAGGVGPAPRCTEEQLAEWAKLRRRAAGIPEEHRIELMQVPTGPTRAAYDHGKACGPCVSWRLDHIFYTPRTLTLRGTWSALEADPESLAAGLPNRMCPSDHLPIAAIFEPSPTPALGEAEAEELIHKVERLEARHADELRLLQSTLEQMEPPAPAAPATGADADPAANAHGGTKRAKGKERPSAEQQALIQEKRRRMREQKELHVRERGSFIGATGELERDVLDRCMCPEVWVATGDRRRPGSGH